MMTANYRSDAAGIIKQTLTAREVVEKYGFTLNRVGYIRCPFHEGDSNASLKVYSGAGGWHCFGCGAGGSVIDFAMRLFDISFSQAIVRLSTDFGLNLANDKASRAELVKLALIRREEAERKAALDKEYKQKAAEYRRRFEIVKYCPPILRADGSIWYHPMYAEAVRELPALEWWLNENMGR